MSKRILVTGGCGFIGSHIVEDLLHRGWSIRILDNFSSGTRANLGKFQNDVEILEGDILDYDQVKSACQHCDVVSHQAAQLEIFLGISEPNKDLEINTIGTLNVLRACHELGVNRIINASSACVYGQPITPSQTEDHPQNPNWEYGVSKLAAEKYCQIYHDTHGLDIASLRYAITYGPREWYRRVLTIFIKRVLQDKPPIVFGQGESVRDFLFVSDAVALHNHLVENTPHGHSIYNAGTGIATSTKELAVLVCQAASKDLEPQFEDVKEGEFSKAIPDKKRNTAELKAMVLDSTKAQTELNWSPQVDLASGIKKELEWASENLDRWERVFSTQW